MSHKHPILALTAIALFSFHLPAAAKIVCCDVNGRRTCGDPPPPQCLTKPKTVFQGGVAKEVEAPLTAEQRAAREVEAARKVEEEKRAAEQARRDRALLDSYTNTGEIDMTRDRAIAEIEKNAEQAKNRLETALKRKEQLDKEREFYLKKPMPEKLEAQIKDNESEIAAQRAALEEKDAKIAETRTRYAADKARYLQLSGKK